MIQNLSSTDPGSLGVNAFGMPLDAQDGQFPVSDRFDTAILGAMLDGDESFSEFSDRLMVCTVYCEASAVEPI